MSVKKFELYLDESGDFNDGKDNRPVSTEPSMVGGILCDSKWMTPKRLMADFNGKRIHACSKYKPSFLTLLQNARKDGCKLVVFENTEKTRVIDSNYTYINIISEGLVHLFRDLSIEYPDGLHIKVVVAQKGMNLKEYQTRLKEKVVMALGRNRLADIDYQLSISDARKDIRLNYPDIICNTWFTKDSNIMKNGSRIAKFPPEARAIIKEIYDPQWIYPVFQDIAITTLNQLLVERHYGEAMFKICTLSNQKGFINVRNKIIKAIENADSYEQDTWFTQMSLLIGQYNRLRWYKDGIKISENYIRHFLKSFIIRENIGKRLLFWLFDTNYFLLTMYDHLGNISKTREHLQVCIKNISSVSRTWEHIDYYFGFRIRELNVLMGCFAFVEVLQRAKKLEKILMEARDLFGIISEDNGAEQDRRSELLGKVYGVELEATINILHSHPEMYDEAVSLSDKAIAEFIDPRDVSRQYQYRCLLMVEAKKSESAYRMLLKALEIEETEEAFKTFLDRAFDMRKGTYDFLLWHYSNVMLLLKKEGQSLGDKMFSALKKNSQFLIDTNDDSKGGHPWNLVLWNIARCARFDGEFSLYKQFYRRAMKITCEEKMNVTMMTFAISMSAEQLLWCRQNKSKDMERAEKEFISICNEVEKMDITDEMKDLFRLEERKNSKSISDEYLSELADTYLK